MMRGEVNADKREGCDIIYGSTSCNSASLQSYKSKEDYIAMSDVGDDGD